MQQARTTKGTAKCGKLSINAPNPIHSNYTKSRFFAVLVSENTGKTLFRTYKKAHFGAFWHLGGQTKGAKGGGVEGWRGGEVERCKRLPEYLNASTLECLNTDNPQQAPR